MTSVSILMPAYNAASTINFAIASVKAQSFRDWELFVINDYSNDETASLVASIAKTDKRIKLLQNNKRIGAAKSRNIGLDAAKGRFIAFLDADDLWLPDKLRQQISVMKEKKAHLCYTGYTVRKKGCREKNIIVPASINYEKLLRGNIIGCLTVVYDAEICGKVPMPLIHSRHDFALWLQILKKHGPACGITTSQAIYHISSNTLSSNKIWATWYTWSMYRNIVGLSIPKTIKCLCCHIMQRTFR